MIVLMEKLLQFRTQRRQFRTQRRQAAHVSRLMLALVGSKDTDRLKLLDLRSAHPARQHDTALRGQHESGHRCDQPNEGRSCAVRRPGATHSHPGHRHR
jgi:hypothetical protein